MASILSLMEQAKTIHPEMNERTHYTIGVMQAFLFLLSTSSQLSTSQRNQLKTILKAWDETLYSSSAYESEA